MEGLVREMQDPETGVPVRSQKLFLTSIPSAFMGKSFFFFQVPREVPKSSIGHFWERPRDLSQAPGFSKAFENRSRAFWKSFWKKKRDWMLNRWKNLNFNGEPTLFYSRVLAGNFEINLFSVSIGDIRMAFSALSRAVAYPAACFGFFDWTCQKEANRSGGINFHGSAFPPALSGISRVTRVVGNRKSSLFVRHWCQNIFYCSCFHEIFAAGKLENDKVCSCWDDERKCGCWS